MPGLQLSGDKVTIGHTIQCNPPIPVWVPKKKIHGLIMFRTDYGVDWDTYYDVFLDNGEVWQLNNKEIRAVENVTYERKIKR